MSRKRIFTSLWMLLLTFTFVVAKTTNKDNQKQPDFFAVASVDKTQADANDQILYTIKFYMEPNAQIEAVGNIHFKFNGFQAEEIDPFFFQNYQAEKYKGKVYRTLTWKQFVLSPEKKGTFVIPSYKATASLIVYTNNNDDMDPFSFFFRQRRGQRKAVKFTTQALKIKISGSKKKTQPKKEQPDEEEDDGIEFKKL